MEGLELGNTSQAKILLPNASVLETNNNDTTSLEGILKIKPIINILLLICLILVMLAMGVSVKADQLIYHIKKPIGISIGMFSQFVVLPLSAFGLLQCVTVSEIHATGVLLMACCPGGVLSNVFSYFCDADLSLSVSMTSLSTLIAMGMMPLNLWIYGRKYETGNIVVPYTNLAVSLVSITSPVCVGMLLGWKFPRIASVLSKIGSFFCIVGVTMYVVSEAIISPNMLTTIPGILYGVILSLPMIGFCLGYTTALLLRQNSKVCKAIALECCVQNVPTVLGIIALSFPAELQREIVALPCLYCFTAIAVGVLFCCIHRVYKKCSPHETSAKGDWTKGTNHETVTLESKETVEGQPMLDQKWEDAGDECQFPETQTSNTEEVMIIKT